MNGSRITGDEASRISLTIGVAVAVALIGAVGYFVFTAFSTVKGMVGFDPNRPIPSDDVLKARLTKEQYHVVREGGTETPFHNAYFNNERAGIYVDIITGEPLFVSFDKIETQTGQLAFTKPISKDLLVEKPDFSHDMQRTEVRVKRSDAHLGHVFDDASSGTGRRYSVNSAALRFIPTEKLTAEGYGAYLALVEQKTVVEQKK